MDADTVPRGRKPPEFSMSLSDAEGNVVACSAMMSPKSPPDEEAAKSRIIVWRQVGSHAKLPCINRQGGLFCSRRMATHVVFAKLARQLPVPLLQFSKTPWTPVPHTPADFNELNNAAMKVIDYDARRGHLDALDVLVPLTDIVKALDVLETCCRKWKNPASPTNFGFLEGIMDDGALVPYLVKGNAVLVPAIFLKKVVPRKTLDGITMEIFGWDVLYLAFCCQLLYTGTGCGNSLTVVDLRRVSDAYGQKLRGKVGWPCCLAAMHPATKHRCVCKEKTPEPAVYLPEIDEDDDAGDDPVVQPPQDENAPSMPNGQQMASVDQPSAGENGFPFPIGQQAGPSDLRAGSSAQEGGPSGVQAVVNGLQPDHRGLEVGPSGLQAGPSGLQPGQQELQAGPSGLQPGQQELLAGPSGLQPGHRGLEAGPSGLQPGQQELQAGPSGLQGSSWDESPPISPTYQPVVDDQPNASYGRVIVTPAVRAKVGHQMSMGSDVTLKRENNHPPVGSAFAYSQNYQMDGSGEMQSAQSPYLPNTGGYQSGSWNGGAGYPWYSSDYPGYDVKPNPSWAPNGGSYPYSAAASFQNQTNGQGMSLYRDPRQYISGPETPPWYQLPEKSDENAFMDSGMLPGQAAASGTYQPGASTSAFAANMQQFQTGATSNVAAANLQLGPFNAYTPRSQIYQPGAGIVATKRVAPKPEQYVVVTKTLVGRTFYCVHYSVKPNSHLLMLVPDIQRELFPDMTEKWIMQQAEQHGLKAVSVNKKRAAALEAAGVHLPQGPVTSAVHANRFEGMLPVLMKAAEHLRHMKHLMTPEEMWVFQETS